MWLAGILLCFLTVGCLAPDDASHLHSSKRELLQQFDVNDVSFLWPAPQSRQERDLLPHLANLSFLSEANFQALLNLTHPGDDASFGFAKRSDWHIVSLRYDPCAKDDSLVQTCRHELRLVMQPFLDGFSARFADHALHLIYQLSSEQSEDVERRLWDLKMSDDASPTNGLPLWVHPSMQQQGLGGTFAQGLTGILQDYAQEKQLREATAMLTINLTQWRFSRSLMNAQGKLERARIPFVQGEMEVLIGEAREGGGIRNEIQPLATGSDHVNQSVDSDGVDSGFYKLSQQEQEQAIQTALRIDNPMIHTPATVDCVSCHMASRVLARVKGQEFLDAVDGNPDRFLAAAGITIANRTYADTMMHGYETRAFGYSAMGGVFPSIIQRTISDSARVADFLNKKRSKTELKRAILLSK